MKGIVFARRLHSTTHKFSRRALSMTKDEGCAIYAVARCSLFDDWRRYLPLTFYLVVFFKKTYGQPISQISIVFVYAPNFCMARQEAKPTLKFGFQVYRQFVCEEGFQDFCVGPILIANYILISPQFKK